MPLPLRLFESGIRKIVRTAATPLVKADTQQLLPAVVRAAQASRIPIDA